MEQLITPFQALQMAAERAGGQSGLARICGITQPAIWKMLQSAKRLTAEYVLRVEAETGVSRHLLRPDIYPLEHHTHASFDDCGPILSARRIGGQSNSRTVLDSREGRAA